MKNELKDKRDGSTAEASRTSPTPAKRSAGAEDGGGKDWLEADDQADEKAVAKQTAKASKTCLDAAAWLEQPDEADTPLIDGLVECGEFVALVGQSKAGKSLFALQAAVCVATGRDFLGRSCVRKRVYLGNLEVSAKQYKKRLRRICAALDVSPEDLRDWLFVDNMRGENATWANALQMCRAHECEVAVVDPFYQIAKIDENDQRACLEAVEEMKPFTKEGIALFVVFHSPKGFSGDRQLIDMISGSAILARVPESVIGLLNHATEKTARVINATLRNYPPFDPFAVTLEDGSFQLAPDTSPDVATSRNAYLRSTANATPAADILPFVVRVISKHRDEAKAAGAEWQGVLLGACGEETYNLMKREGQKTPSKKSMSDLIQSLPPNQIKVTAKTQIGKFVGTPEDLAWYAPKP